MVHSDPVTDLETCHLGPYGDNNAGGLMPRDHVGVGL
jgi:hypothetical protein